MNTAAVVRRLMVQEPGMYLEKPAAYENREKLILHVQRIMLRKVAPESVTRAQRKYWESIKREYTPHRDTVAKGLNTDHTVGGTT